jgi:DNA-binding NarL/FixJ family response regulator
MNPKTPTPVRAVVVDDVDVMRQLLRLLLERGGQCTVVAEADNGQSGVTAVLAHRPDLVLLDVTMPGMDGVQALKLIRSQVPSAVVVMLSTWETTSRQANTCTALGAHGFLRKDGNIHLVPDEVGAIVRATRSLG